MLAMLVNELMQSARSSDRLSSDTSYWGLANHPLLLDHALLKNRVVMGKLEVDSNDPNATVDLRESTAKYPVTFRTERDSEIGDPTATIAADGSATLNVFEMYLEPTNVDTADSRFSVLRHHASGGLGKVSVARDHQLQRDGDLSATGPLADVYSLEATLYQVLTGRPQRATEAIISDDGRTVCVVQGSTWFDFGLNLGVWPWARASSQRI